MEQRDIIPAEGPTIYTEVPRYGALQVVGEYQAQGRGKSRYICLCDCGNLVDAEKYNVASGNSSTCGDQKKHRRRKPSPVTGYSGMHERLRREHGSARHYECVDCGRQAGEWSFNGSPVELLGLSNGQIVKYSMRMRDYSPRCVPCHRAADGNPVGGGNGRT